MSETKELGKIEKTGDGEEIYRINANSVIGAIEDNNGISAATSTSVFKASKEFVMDQFQNVEMLNKYGSMMIDSPDGLVSFGVKLVDKGSVISVKEGDKIRDMKVTEGRCPVMFTAPSAELLATTKKLKNTLGFAFAAVDEKKSN